MRLYRQRYLAVLAGMLLLSLCSNAANANRGLQLSSGRVTGTAAVTFTVGPAGRTVTSLVTLEASLHRTISKSAGTLVGTITNCNSSLAEAGLIFIRVRVNCDLNLPLHIRYVFFTGSLPNIREIRVVILSLTFYLSDLAGASTINCLFRGNLEAQTLENPIRGFRFDETPGLPVHLPELYGCERESLELRVRGTLRLSSAQILSLI